MNKNPIISLLFLLILLSCSTNNMKDFNDYKEYELNSLDLFYSLPLNYYFVYLMNDECKDCEEIKDDILSYYENNKEPIMYFYNMKSFGTKEGMENRNKFQDKNEFSAIYNINVMLETRPNTLKETYFYCTPSLYVVKNNRLDNFIDEGKDIIDFINK